MNVIVSLSWILIFAVCLADPNPEDMALTTVSSAHQRVSYEPLRCDSSHKTMQKICKSALTKVNARLFKAAVSVDSNSFLFTYGDPDENQIPNGESCSRTYKITGKRASVQFSPGARLKFNLKSITQPSVLSIKIPVKLQASVEGKEEYGLRFFGICNIYARNSYSFKDNTSTVGTIAIGLSLDPEFAKLHSGNYFVKIKPKFTVLFTLEDFNLNLKPSYARTPFGILNSVKARGPSILKSVAGLVQGDIVSDIIDEAFPFTLNLPIVLGTGSLPKALEHLIRKKIQENSAMFSIPGKRKKYSYDLQDSINRNVKTKLKLNFGLDYILVRKD